MASTSSSSSHDRLFGRQRSVHEILGGGVAADVILWRRKNATVGILMGTLAAWVLFELSGYTLLSLVANVLLLLLSILFVWAKAAGVLNRPRPPIPMFHLSEEVVNEAASFLRSRFNTLFSIAYDIALGKDSKLFCKVATYLLLISVIGSLTDFLTLGYTGLALVLTVPAIYEKYEYQIDKFGMLAYAEIQQLYIKLDTIYFDKVRKWILEKRKLS